MNKRISYNIELLSEILNKNNSILKEYSIPLTRNSNIMFTCVCGKDYMKNFKVISMCGAFCKDCTNKIQYEQIKNNRNEKNNNILKESLNRDNAKIKGKYIDLKASTIVSFICNCNKEYNKNLTNIIYNGGAFCKECSANNKKNKTNITVKEKYGVDFIMQIPDTKLKIKNTCLLKYGVENPSKNKEIQEKIIHTNLEKYGVKYTCLDKNIKEKQINTLISNYGVRNPSQNISIKDKIKNTYLKNYSDKNSEKYKNMINSRNNTCIIKYGIKNPSQNISIKEKIKNTYLKNYSDKNSEKYKAMINNKKINSNNKYGTDYPQQSINIQEKIQTTGKKYKKYKMPSGEIRNVQGYEPYALDELVKLYKEEEIKTNRKDIPRIKYIMNDIEKYYFPDIFIPIKNKIIEVKSSWTYKKKMNITLEKGKSCKDKGYNFEIWIYNEKKDKQIIIL